MSQFVRKGLLTCSGTFVATDGSGTQPSAAILTVTYDNLSGNLATDTVGMTLSNGVWSGQWDSSRSSAGAVSWSVASTGPIQAATQGDFTIVANAANINSG